MIAAALIGVIVIVSVVAVVVRFDDLSGSALLSLVATGLGLLLACATLVTDSGRLTREKSRQQAAKVFERISEAEDLLSVLSALAQRDDGDATKTSTEAAPVMDRLLEIRQSLIEMDELAHAARVDAQLRATLRNRPEWLLWKANAALPADKIRP